MKDKEKIGLLFVAIIIMILFIILPPLLRIFSPKDNESTVKDDTKLVCEKDAIDNYNIKITTTYQKGKITQIEFVFTDNNQSHNNSNSEQFFSGDSQNLINYYSSLVGSYYSITNNKHYITLSNETKENYPNDTNIKRIFQDYNKTKKYYLDNDYTCK